jgi:hypothetical protein
MKPHELKLIEMKIEQNYKYTGSHYCESCGHSKAPVGNKCSICYMIDIKDAMSPEEFEAYENEYFTGVSFR